MMIDKDNKNHHSTLQIIAHRLMIERGLLPDFPTEVLTELDKLKSPASTSDKSIRDLRNLLWCSIDNDDSLDLDQLTTAISLPDGLTKILVAIADVDSLIKKNSAIDLHAQHNTISIYTTAEIFPMLPEKISTNLTSLNFNSERLAIIVEMVVKDNGEIKDYDIYRALVTNHAKLAYNSLAAWLEGKEQTPESLNNVDGLDKNLQLQNTIAKKLKSLRHLNGALDLETIEARYIFHDGTLNDIEDQKTNDAKDIIQDFMISANGITAKYLESKKIPSIRRIVRTPKRWERIVELAAEQKFNLPIQPDSKSLDQFLIFSKSSDPLHFPDLSLSIIKLLGSGEYVVELPGENTSGHFGLAVKDYTHSTAPNRRYADLITQRLLKASISNSPVPYSIEELNSLASHCTEMANAAKKVERQVQKSAAAMLLESRIGETFDAIVTGNSEKGIWVRILHPPVEGKLINGHEVIDVGHRIRVQLISTDIEKGFIDFKKTV